MLKFYILLCCLYFITALNIKIFNPNTNYGNINNWEEHHLPCDKSHIILPSKSPKIFINGTSQIHYISEMVLPYNGVLILDDSNTFTVSDITKETPCDVVMAHYNRIQPDFWYDPLNWCQTHTISSLCQHKPQIEASMVPSSSDSVVFKRGNTFHVGLKGSESKIVAREILLRGVKFKNSFLFLKKISKSAKESVIEFEKENSNRPPKVELKGDRCNENSCLVNSNLKLMSYICAYVTCRELSCKRPIRPSGSCCRLCGQLFSVKIKKDFIPARFESWFEDMMEMYYKTSVIFNVLSVERNKLEIVISLKNNDADLAEALANEIIEKIIMEKVMQGVESVEGRSWMTPVYEKYKYSWTLVTILVVFVLLILLTFLFMKRRNIPYLSRMEDNFKLRIQKVPRINFPTINFNFCHDNFQRTRLKEDIDTNAASDNTMTNATEVIELPEKVFDVSFDNPIYEREMGYEDSVQ